MASLPECKVPFTPGKIFHTAAVSSLETTAIEHCSNWLGVQVFSSSSQTPY